MHTGMLWLINDDTRTTLPQKIQAALDYFKQKYGKVPTLVLANPNMEAVHLDGIEIHPYGPILPRHLWIGVEEVQKVEEKQEAEEE
jgi:hypothetical protein